VKGEKWELILIHTTVILSALNDHLNDFQEKEMKNREGEERNIVKLLSNRSEYRIEVAWALEW